MATQTYGKYTYKGPVLEFGKCIANEWEAETFATSEKKARSNMTYQFKKKNNRNVNTNITLPGRVEMVS